MNRFKSTIGVVISAAAVGACGASERDGFASGSGITGGSGSGGGSEDTGPADPGEDSQGPGTGSDETSSGEGDSSGVRFDVGGAGDTSNTDPTAGGGERCEKVDFLFVIDNSGSMEDEQIALADSFPGFIRGIRDVAGIQDFRILVTDSDADAASAGCPGSPGASGDSQVCRDWCEACPPRCSCVCGGVECPPPTPTCDLVLGAGQIKDNTGQGCNVAGDARYMDQNQPDLEQTFSCIAIVGTNGDGNERPMQAAGDAVTTLVEVGECNDGFLRDDAVLVVTIITDEEDIDKSPGGPPEWRERFVDAKRGNEASVVALAIVGDSDVPGGLCAAPTSGAGDGAEGAPRLREWAESFTFGQWGSVCADDYSPFLEEAISVINTACDDFIPPG